MLEAWQFPDLIAEETVIVELKTAKCIEDIHLAQTLNYLKAIGLKLGLIINFGKARVEIKRVINNFYPRVSALICGKKIINRKKPPLFNRDATPLFFLLKIKTHDKVY